MMSSPHHYNNYDNNNNNNNAVPAKQVHPFVSPFADEQTSVNNNSFHQQYNNATAAAESMTRDAMGLKAASHVSMDGSPQAHEYQPTCPCNDCQMLLSQFTQYDILDAFVAQHLKYEADIEKAYGFVPCIGGASGNVATRKEVDDVSGEVTYVPETSTALVFHFHCHHMKEVPHHIRVNSCNRFYEHRFNSNNKGNNNNNNNNTAASASTHHHHNNSRSVAAPATVNAPNNAAASHNYNNNYSQQQTQTLRVPHPHSRMMVNNNNGNHKAAVRTSTTDHQHMNNNAYATQPCFYTARDMQMTSHSVAYTEAARLGC